MKISLLPKDADGYTIQAGTALYVKNIAIFPSGWTPITLPYDCKSIVIRARDGNLKISHEEGGDYITVTELSLDIVVPAGCVQYTDNTYDGFNLIDITSLGIGHQYCAFGDWDNTTVGKCVKWSTLSDDDKQKWLTNPVNMLYLDGEKVIQVRYRYRVIQR